MTLTLEEAQEFGAVVTLESVSQKLAVVEGEIANTEAQLRAVGDLNAQLATLQAQEVRLKQMQQELPQPVQPELPSGAEVQV
jgi:uncharacterized small protein (DUF1192 family)